MLRPPASPEPQSRAGPHTHPHDDKPVRSPRHPWEPPLHTYGPLKRRPTQAEGEREGRGAAGPVLASELCGQAKASRPQDSRHSAQRGGQGTVIHEGGPTQVPHVPLCLSPGKQHLVRPSSLLIRSLGTSWAGVRTAVCCQPALGAPRTGILVAPPGGGHHLQDCTGVPLTLLARPTREQGDQDTERGAACPVPELLRGRAGAKSAGVPLLAHLPAPLRWRGHRGQG